MKRAIHYLVAMLLAGLAACGEPPQTQGNTVLADAVATSFAFDTMRMEISGSMEMTGKGLTGKTLLQGQGRSIISAQRTSVSITTRSPEGAFMGLPMDSSVRAVMDGTVMYMKMPVVTSMVEGGEEWISFDLADMGDELGIDVSTLGFGSTDPTQGLDYLVGAVDVKEIGTEEIRGEPTTHYSFVIDLDAYADDNPEARESVDKLIDLMGLSTYPGDVWIAEDGTIRKLSYLMDMKRMDGVEGRMKSLTVMEIFDYGAPVRIKVPAPSDVMSLEEFQDFQTNL